MTIKVIINGTYYDISSIVKYDIAYSDDISKELDTADFVIPVTESNKISGLDLSVPFKQLTRVEISFDNITKRYYVREDEVELISQVAPKLYSHKVSLIEPTKILELKPVPNMTITQPQGTYTIASSQLDIDPSDRSGARNDLLLTDAIYNLIDFENTTAPTDTSIINEETLKLAGREYTLYFNIELYNALANAKPNWDIRIKINGVTKITDNVEATSTLFEKVNKLYTLTYTTSVANELVTVEIKPNNNLPEASVTYASTVGLDIRTKIETVDSPVWYFDEVIDKVLISQKVADINDTGFTQEFTLNDDTRNLIKNYVAPELTFESRTVWEIIEELADIVKAIPRLSKDTWNEITFDFIDTINKTVWTNVKKTEERQQLVLDKFSTAIEINADNVIESVEDQAVKVEPYEDGWMTLRSDSEGPNQLTDTTVGLKVRSNIYKHKQVLAKGFTVEYSDATTDPATKVWDISNYVVEEKKWQSLLNVAYDSVTERNSVNHGKGNTIYYSKEGQRYVNFGYRSPVEISGTTAPDQVIYQIIAAVAQQETGKTVSTVNGGGASQTLAKLLDTQYRVYYNSYKKVRVRLYKHNARDYEFDTILYSNEQSKVNDNIRLGRYSQTLANKSGNKSIIESGITDSINNVPKVGQIANTDDIITKVDVVLKKGLYEYGITGFEKYAAISNYVGIKSEYRQYQIPDKDVVERNLVYEDYYTIGKELKAQSYKVIESAALDNLVAPFVGLLTNPITYHQMKTRNNELNPGDAGWTTFDSETEGPVETISFGTTMAIMCTVKDNYSVDDIVEGKEKVTGVPSKWYQNNARYKNAFGQYDSARYSLFLEGANNNSVSDGNAYPDIDNTSTVGKVLDIDIRTKTDGREAIYYTHQFNFFSGLNAGVEDFRVYNGIAKYNGFAIENAKADIVAVLLLDGYFPSVETVFIDATKYEETTYTASNNSPTYYIASTYQVDVPATPTEILYTGWGLIEKTTGELIFLNKTNIQSASLNPTISTQVVYTQPDETKGK